MKIGNKELKRGNRTKRRSAKRNEKKSSVWSCAICSLVIAIALIAGLFIAEPMVQFDFQVGDIATESITATRDIEDLFVTNQLIEQARNEIQDIYRSDSSKSAAVYEKVQKVVSAIDYIFTESKAHFTAWKTSEASKLVNPGEPDDSWEPDSEEYRHYWQELEDYNKLVDYYNSIEFSDVLADEALYVSVFNEDFLDEIGFATDYIFNVENEKVIISASAGDISLIKNNLPEIVLSKLNSGIRENELIKTREDIKNLLKVLGPDESLDVVIDVIIGQVTYNEYYDEAQTEEARRIAEEAVEPIIYKKGQTIVTAGQPITEAQYKLIEELGMLKSGANEYSNYISLSVAIIIICIIHLLMFVFYRKSIVISMKNNIIVAVLIIVSMYMFIFLKLQNVYVCTSMLAVILITMLIDGRAALITGMEMSLFMGMYAGCDFSVTLSSAVACTVCACMIKKASSSRSKIILMGLVSAVAELLVVTAMEYYMTAKFNSILNNTFWIMLGGLASSILAIGLLSVFENVFNVITPIRLLELSNQSQPVLKRLQLEATGTYYHSIMVGNMAETAANDIGADGLLARTGAYYHDIGKLMRPQMFTENQTDDYNPHSELPPEVSARMIISHVNDGLKIASENGVPQILYPFIEEHHGSTLASFFYYNACEIYGKENVNINDYKYSGKTPTSKECAIIMLADTVEAAVRSMKDRSPENLRSAINDLVEGKIAAGQLENCPITFKEISTIKQSFFRILSGVYHRRIEYPKARAAEPERINETVKANEETNNN